jgi:hypothetical protein
MSWQSTVGRISAAFSFDPATNELKYTLTAKGFAKDDILAATLHRTEKADAGPAIAVLSNHAFEKLAGAETLSSVDRERLLSGGLYLRVATRLKDTASIRMPLTPDSAPRPPQPE